MMIFKALEGLTRLDCQIRDQFTFKLDNNYSNSVKLSSLVDNIMIDLKSRTLLRNKKNRLFLDIRKN